jgi:hypothetical protein
MCASLVMSLTEIFSKDFVFSNAMKAALIAAQIARTS